MIWTCKTEKILNLQTITDALKNSIASRLSLENACLFYEVTKHFSYKNLRLTVLKYIQDWFCLITNNKKHLHLSFDSVRYLLSNDGLRVSTEVEIFKAASDWIELSLKERSKFSTELVKLVRFSFLSSACLNLLLNTENSFSKCPKSKEHIEKFLISHKSTGNNKQRRTRYHSRESFYVTVNPGLFCNYLETYQICGFEDKKAVSCTKKPDGTVRAALFLNGTIHLMSQTSIKSYSTLTRSWEKKADYPDRFWDFSACCFAGKLWVFGGNSRRGFSFDPATGAFERAPPMAELRHWSASTAFECRIVVLGGLRCWDTMRVLKSVEAYCAHGGGWSRMPEMNELRYGHASVAVGSKLYVVGGHSVHCEAFDSLSGKFTRLKPMQHKCCQFRTKCLAVGGKIKIYDDTSLDAIVFDVEKEKWTWERGVDLGMHPNELHFC